MKAEAQLTCDYTTDLNFTTDYNKQYPTGNAIINGIAKLFDVTGKFLSKLPP
jgi:hypothetical protein